MWLYCFQQQRKRKLVSIRWKKTSFFGLLLVSEVLQKATLERKKNFIKNSTCVREERGLFFYVSLFVHMKIIFKKKYIHNEFDALVESVNQVWKFQLFCIILFFFFPLSLNWPLMTTATRRGWNGEEERNIIDDNLKKNDFIKIKY